VGGCFLLRSVNKTKTLTKTALSMLVAWWSERDNVLTYLPEKSWLRIGLSFLWTTKASKT
jgi:hypothetical protein